MTEQPAADAETDRGRGTPVSDALAEFMAGGWGLSDSPLSPPAPPPATLAARRRALRAAVPEGVVVVAAGAPVLRTGDQFHPYRASSDYVWLTGDQTPGVLVMPVDADPVLYLEPPASRSDGTFWRSAVIGDLWVGPRPTLEVRSAELGIECRPLAELPDPPAEERAPGVEVACAHLRLVKDEWEIGELRRAVDSTVRGFEDVARVLRSGRDLHERAVEVAFDARARREGNTVGYQTIAASGGHAGTLHWIRNDADIAPRDLLLFDAGVETTSLYTADVTRTLPVSGRFGALQREVYDVVFAAQEAGLACVKPGARFDDFYAESARVLAEGLSALGVLPVSAAESLRPESGLHRRWTICSPGHPLGLDVHDCGGAPPKDHLESTLEPGQVLTVEPGLYFQSNDELIHVDLRGIGVRIEDDILVTDDGYENLSGGLPRAAADVEDWMRSV